jgi:hypothetical protein
LVWSLWSPQATLCLVTLVSLCLSHLWPKVIEEKEKKGKAFFIAVLLVEVTAASVSSIKHSSFCFSVYFPSPKFFDFDFVKYYNKCYFVVCDRTQMRCLIQLFFALQEFNRGVTTDVSVCIHMIFHSFTLCICFV